MRGISDEVGGVREKGSGKKRWENNWKEEGSFKKVTRMGKWEKKMSAKLLNFSSRKQEFDKILTELECPTFFCLVFHPFLI